MAPMSAAIAFWECCNRIDPNDSQVECQATNEKAKDMCKNCEAPRQKGCKAIDENETTIGVYRDGDHDHVKYYD